MAKSTDLPTLTEWLKAHPGEHLLPAATVAREADIKEATLRGYAGASIKAAGPARRRHMQAIHWRKPSPTQGNTTHDHQD